MSRAVKSIVRAVQESLDGPPIVIIEQVWLPGRFAELRYHCENLIEHGHKIVRCLSCNLPMPDRKAQHTYDYEPFDDEPVVNTFCIDCFDRCGDEDTFFCEGCCRDIFESNRYRLNYKSLPDGELICVRCYQRGIFKHGHTLQELDSGQVWCDWYNHSELTGNGFESVLRIYAKDPARMLADWQEVVRDQMARGFVCATDQGPTGLGNPTPDWIEVWAKPATQEEVA